MDTSLLIGLIVGLALGGGTAYLVLLARGRTAAAESARAVAEGNAILRADAAALRAERASLLERLDELGEAHDRTTERLRRAEAEAAAAQAALRAEREAGQRREELLAARDQELKQAFAALSADALARNNEQFVALAETRIKEAASALAAKSAAEDAEKAAAVSKLLDPVAAALTRVEGQLRTVEKEREAAYASLREQVNAMRQSSEQLKNETKALVNALRAPHQRGRWGELQLERIVQLAGMVEHCDFSTQVSAQTADGGVRPDLVVHLAGGKQIVVDAKVPFAAYLEAVEAADAKVHAERLAAHARQLRQHVDQLAAKSYWAVFDPSPEFVVLFVPGDPFLQAALQADPTLLEHAFSQNVVIATPTTLIALLRTVAYTWRQEALARNAAQVHQLGKELHGRLATMGTHVAKLGRGLDAAVEAYNRTVASLETRVLVTARKLTELHVSDDELPEIGQVDRAPRRLSAPELVASASESLIDLHEMADGTHG
ncbi:DNA recombination protein RmuC [Pseudonocardia thermophila]|uniref:DNA recombination protein RmuC n=1 Tax=Pseudonocardia thermophila TaxID=1848 RepID=A0A1M6WHL1_PSETH|nr:DNA recombination protein RmuC [Pseudonocardia thermophila]SHK93161.1 DNA recombination protein RmuC [Pseudonocardia thermophila]